MKDKVKNNNINSIYNKLKMYRIIQKIISSGLAIVLGGILTIGLIFASVHLPKILFEANIISQNVEIILYYVFPILAFVSGMFSMAFGFDALSNHFEKKKDECIKKLMELSKQKEKEFDNTRTKNNAKIEKEIKEYTYGKNNKIMAKVNLYTSVTKFNNLIKQELEEEWKIYLFDKISQGVSDEFIKEIILGLTLLHSDYSIEEIYAKLPKNIAVIEDLIHFSPRGKELKNNLPKLDSNFATRLDNMNHVYTAVNITLHR